MKQWNIASDRLAGAACDPTSQNTASRERAGSDIEIWENLNVRISKLSSFGLILASVCTEFLSLYTGAIAKSSIETFHNGLRLANRYATSRVPPVACARKNWRPEGFEPTTCRAPWCGGLPLSRSTTAKSGCYATSDPGIAAGSPPQRSQMSHLSFESCGVRSCQLAAIYRLHPSTFCTPRATKRRSG